MLEHNFCKHRSRPARIKAGRLDTDAHIIINFHYNNNTPKKALKTNHHPIHALNMLYKPPLYASPKK